jgi:hypothetical protein
MRFFRAAIILAAVAVAAFVAYWFFEIRQKQQKQEAAEQEALLFDFDADKVDRISLVSPDQRIVMVREAEEGEMTEGDAAGGEEASADTGADGQDAEAGAEETGDTETEEEEEPNWSIVEPVETPGDATSIGGLITHLGNLKRSDVVYEDLSKLSEYKLDQPSYSVRFTIRGEEGERGVDFGIKSLDDKKVFARVVGREQIITIPSEMRGNLSRTLFDVRDKTLVHFETGDLEGMVVLSGMDQIVLQKKDDGEWYLMPDEIPASDTRVDLFTGALQWGTFVAVEEEKGENLAPYGLHQPRLIATLFLEDKSPVLFSVGAPVDEERQFYYATRSSDGLIFQVKADTLNRLAKRTFDLKDRSIFNFTDDQVTSITMEWGDKAMTFEREGDGWKFADSGEVVEKAYKIDNVLRGIRTAEYQEHEPLHRGEPGYEETGIQDPAYTFTVRFEDKSPVTMHLTEKSDETGRLYLTPDSGETVYNTTGYFLTNLPQSREEMLGEE